MLKSISKNRIYTILIIGLLGIVTQESDAQQTHLLVANSKEKPGKEINLKWISNDVIYPEGVNIYRREESLPFWELLNDAPYMRGNYVIPSYAYEQDSTLSTYELLARDIQPEEVEGMTKAFLLLKSVYNNHFSAFLGIQYNDTTFKPGIEYRYMVKRIKNGREIFEAVSEPLIPGPFTPGAPPKEIRIEAKNKKVNFWWKIEDERFHSLNIYRYSNVNSSRIKINDLPIVLSKIPDTKGRLTYPEVFYTDKSVLNDTNYFYQLAGIDFFGRETAYSDPIMVSPKNRKPPPAATLDPPKVDLLNIELTWNPGIMDKVVGYHIYRTPSIHTSFERVNSELLSTLSVRYQDKLDKPGNYYYYVATVDKNGNEGKSNMVIAEILDIWPPAAPTSLTTISDTGKVTLNWSAVEDEKLMGYRIYRTIDANDESYYVLLNTDPVAETTYEDRLPFNARNQFYYVVAAVDSSLNVSDYSSPSSAILPDVVPPDAPFIKGVKPVDGAFEISWLANRDIDLLGYHLYRINLTDTLEEIKRINKELIPSGNHDYVDILVEDTYVYSYYLKAIDSVGNLSAKSNHVMARQIPVVEKSNPALKDISLKKDMVNDQIVISWHQVSKEKLKGVVVFRKEETTDLLRPVSGILKENQFIESTPKNSKRFIYVVVSYALTGEKWTSGEYPIEITE